MSRHQKKPSLSRTLHHLRRPLAPLVSITTGQAHPSFPRTLLHYHLLTLSELNALAHYYHQRTPTEHSFGYPLSVLGRWHAPPYAAPGSPSAASSDSGYYPMNENASATSSTGSSRFNEQEQATLHAVKGLVGDGMKRERRDGEEVEAKRRRFGRFVGLRGCESPGMEDEEIMKAAMEEWVSAGFRRCQERQAGRERWRGKGCW